MLNIPETIKALYRIPNSSLETWRTLRMRFYDKNIDLLYPSESLFPSEELFPVDDTPVCMIAGTQIPDDNFTLTQVLCSAEALTFGQCGAAMVEVTVDDVPVDLTGMWFTLSVEVGGYEMMLGIFKVDSFERQADRSKKKIVAYDRMLEFEADVSGWYHGLTFPMKLKQFRDSLCTHIGVSQLDTVLPLDELLVTKSIDPSKLSGREVMRRICEINGCFGQIDVTGSFRYVFLGCSSLYPSEDLFPADDLFPAEMDGETLSHYKEATYEDFLVHGIERVQIRQEEGDVGAVYGEGSNTYTIQGNFLAYGKSAEMLEYIASVVFDNIGGRVYRPCKIITAGLPWVEPGDGIICHTSDDVIETYCLKRTIRGIQAMMDTFEAKGTKERKENFGIQTQIQQLEGKAAVIKKSVEEVSVKVIDLKEYTEAQVKILADSITLEVTRAKDEEAKLAASIRIQADQIALEVTRAKAEEAKLSASLKIQAGLIEAKVSKGEVSSQLSIEPDAITLKTNRLSWQSTNSSMTADGTLTCRNIRAVNGRFSGEIEGSRIVGSQFEGGQLDIGSLYADEDHLEFGKFRIMENGGRLESGDFWVKPGPGGVDSTMGVYQINCSFLSCKKDIYFDDSWTEGDSLLKMLKQLYGRTNDLSRRISELGG